MRHGRQTPGRRLTGYKLHAAVAADVPIETAISVAPANEHDGRQSGGLVDQQPEQPRPERVIGDTAYGNSEAREDLAQRSIRVLAPVHSSSPKQGTSPKDAFTIDLQWLLASDAAKTSAKPPCKRYPIPPSASISNAPGRASNGCSDLIVHRYHARKSRYLGARKATLQAAWTAVLVNLHPIAAALRAQTA